MTLAREDGNVSRAHGVNLLGANHDGISLMGGGGEAEGAQGGEGE